MAINHLPVRRREEEEEEEEVLCVREKGKESNRGFVLVGWSRRMDGGGHGKAVTLSGARLWT